VIFSQNLIEISHATDIIATSCGLTPERRLRPSCRLPLTTSLIDLDLSLFLLFIFDMSAAPRFTPVLWTCVNSWQGTIRPPHNGILASCMLPAERGRLHPGRRSCIYQGTVDTGLSHGRFWPELHRIDTVAKMDVHQSSDAIISWQSPTRWVRVM
jgi:hypothetical protein